MIHDFYKSIKENKKPLSSDLIALDVSKVLESAQLSIDRNGSEIFLADFS
jgi:hypothetical protein